MHATVCMGCLGTCMSWDAWDAWVHASHSIHRRSGEDLRCWTSPPPLFETGSLAVHHCVSHANWTTRLRGFPCLCLSQLHRTLGFQMCVMVLSSMWVLGTQTQILMLVQQTLCPPNHISKPIITFHLHCFNFERLKFLYRILLTLRECHTMYLDHVLSTLLPQTPP